MLLIGLLMVLGWNAFNCIGPASFRQVKSPREGRVLDHRVALVYSKHYQINMGGAEHLHSFDIRKYAKIYVQLLTDGVIQPTDVFVPEAVTREQILLVHTEAYLESLKDSSRVAQYLEAPAVGFMPASLADAGILNAFRYATGGSIEAARQAMRHGIGINIGGGYHHAKPDKGEGFCVYNDLAIAIRVLQKEGLIRRALVVDLDAHQGNGTAVAFAGDADVFTFDVHEGDIYPWPKEKCSLDVDLPAHTGDEEYLRLLREKLPGVIEKARPDLVFLQAGCDVLKGDPLTRMAMTPEGVVRRDLYVIQQCVEHNLPVAMVTGGGYSDQAWQVQYQSIRKIIETYAPARPTYPHRDPTIAEKLYRK